MLLQQHPMPIPDTGKGALVEAEAGGMEEIATSSCDSLNVLKTAKACF